MRVDERRCEVRIRVARRRLGCVRPERRRGRGRRRDAPSAISSSTLFGVDPASVLRADDDDDDDEMDDDGPTSMTTSGDLDELITDFSC